MKTKSHAFCFATLIALVLIPLNAEESAPKPDAGGANPQPAPRVLPPPGNEHTSPNDPQRPKMEHRTLAVSELRDIRFNVEGTISFRHPSTGNIYTWMAPNGESRQVVLATVLTELRRAEKVDLVVYSAQQGGGGNEFRIVGLTLVYDSLK